MSPADAPPWRPALPCRLALLAACFEDLPALRAPAFAAAEPLLVTARSRIEIAPGSGMYRIVEKEIRIEPAATAIIICDMWNTLCCKIPADRVAEMAPRMNEFVAADAPFFDSGQGVDHVIPAGRFA